MKKIKKSPSQASIIKINHFSNIGVIEIFLEAVPTAFILVLISIVGLNVEVDGTDGLSYVLIGVNNASHFNNDLWSFSLFCITCATSMFSVGFGMARYKVCYIALPLQYINREMSILVNNLI